MIETIVFIVTAVVTFTATEVTYQIGVRYRRRHARTEGR